jgi:5'-nucleotidase
MGVQRYGEHFIKRQDPRGRTYYWATNEPPPEPGDVETDLTALQQGFVTLTPLQYDMTQYHALQEMADWSVDVRESV